MTNPLTLPSITGGDALAGQSSATGVISGNFSVGGQSATETVTSAFKSTGFQIILVGGVVFLGAIFLRGRK